jgi:predicted NACHT family NTPase
MPRWRRALGISVGALGIGVLASLAYVHVLRPVWVVVFGAVWAAVVGLVSQIWQRTAKTIVDIASLWLDAHIRDFAYGYRKRYYEHLIHRHRTFDVKGLTTQSVYSLEIEQVYVDLSIEPSQLTTVSSSIVQNFSASSRGSIWDFLASIHLTNQSFAIIGAPGSGKTTLLKHVTLALAAHNGNAHGQKYVPVLLFIRDHAESIGAKETISLEDVLLESITKMGIPAPVDWFKRALAAGKCLVLFDGLDEVADPKLRRKVATWVQNQAKAYGANRFILSSRPFGYKSNPLGGVTVLEVRPFNLEQVRDFVGKWYFANEVMSAQKNDEGVRISAREASEDLLRRLRSTPALLDLALNPLLLTMITTVHRYRGSLPGRRVELYAEICHVFWGRRQQARGMDLELTPAQKKRVLQPLAYHIMSHEKREISIERPARRLRAH